MYHLSRWLISRPSQTPGVALALTLGQSGPGQCQWDRGPRLAASLTSCPWTHDSPVSHGDRCAHLTDDGRSSAS